MINYTISFFLFAVFLHIEKCLSEKKNGTTKFHLCFAIVGIIGLIIVNVLKVFQLENFFILIFASSIYELWKKRKKQEENQP